MSNPLAQQSSSAAQSNPTSAVNNPCCTCAAASVSFAALDMGTIGAGQISLDRVLAAGALMEAHQYLVQLRFSAAISRAWAKLDTDEICLDLTKSNQQSLLDQLACWPEQINAIDPRQRAQVFGKLGVYDPAVPDVERNTTIQPMITDVLDAVIARRGRRGCGKPAKAAVKQLVRSTAELLQSTLSSSMTESVVFRTRQLHRELSVAQQILTDLATVLRTPCRPGISAAQGLWGVVDVLVGRDLAAAGVNMYQAAAIAQAWQIFFQWLSYSSPVGRVSADLFNAATLLTGRTGLTNTTTPGSR